MDKNSLREKLKISFIVPCYNAEKTVDETVNSILSLELRYFEICLVDDGSADRTWERLESFRKKYPGIIKIENNSENRGGGYTRNRCFSMSTHPYIFCLDSDNVLHTESFFRLLNVLEEQDSMITFDTIKFFYSTPFDWLKLCYKSSSACWCWNTRARSR